MSQADIDIDRLVEKTTTLFIAIQNAYEMSAFLKVVQNLCPRTVVEIGTARGGMFYGFSQLAQRDALLVSIDLPGSENGGGQTESELSVLESFGPPTQRFCFLRANSHEEATRHSLVEALDGRKIDLLFIDGDHTYQGVKGDFEAYKSLVSPNGLIAFHDICLFPDEWGESVGVGLFWSEIASQHKVMEIIDPHGTFRKEKRPGEKAAWGIGVIERSNSG
jgi:predicted O-methyltransferase YrrM